MPAFVQDWFLSPKNSPNSQLKHGDEQLRAMFTMDFSLYSPEKFVFLDETGADRRNTIRKYGYIIHGMPAIYHRLLVRGTNFSGGIA